MGRASTRPIKISPLPLDPPVTDPAVTRTTIEHLIESFMKRGRLLLLILLLPLISGACTLRPEGMALEQGRAAREGEAYRRPLPELPEKPTWRELLHRAFLANGELEAGYHEWMAALAKVDKEAAWPNTSLRLGFESMFTPEAMKSWDRTTLSAGFTNDALTLPLKAAQSGKVAFAEARATGERFFSKKFSLQRKVLEGWIDYGLAGARLRTERENVDLLRVVVQIAEARVRAGAPQQDLIKAQLECERTENLLLTIEAEIKQLKSTLNALLARDPDAALSLPETLPPPRSLPGDELLLQVAVAGSPELSELTWQVEGQKDALERAKMMYLPDISPAFSITGSIAKTIGAMVMLPSNLAAVRADVAQMRSMVMAREAMLRQTKLERHAEFIATLVGVRDYERQIDLFQERIVPSSRLVMRLSEQSYASGRTEFMELIDSHHLFTESRLALLEALAGREKKIAALEALAGVDIEALSKETK